MMWYLLRKRVFSCSRSTQLLDVHMNQRWRLSAEFETQVRLPQPIHVGVRCCDLHDYSTSPLARQIQHSDNLIMRARDMPQMRLLWLSLAGRCFSASLRCR